MSPNLAEPALRRYLLGSLPESEVNSLEERYFVDSEAFEQVWAAENELVDDYAAGRLTPDERRLFEEHYLSSPLHRSRLATIQALRAARAVTAATPAAARAVTAATPAASRPPAPSRLGYLALAASFFIVLGLFWILRPRPDAGRTAGDPPTPIPTASTQISPAPTPTAASVQRGSPPVVAAFALSPFLARGTHDQARLRLPSGADEVLLHLEGDPVGPGRLAFSLRTVEGEAIASGRALPAGGRPGRVASVRLPAATLSPGDYILQLSAAGQDDPAYQYYFRVLGR
jgi:hypothetical protein